MTELRDGCGGTAAPASGASAVDDIEARAARLGITRDRVLEELRNIAFADIRNLVSWHDGKLKITDPPPDKDSAAIAEIVGAAKDGLIYRIKLYDKGPVLVTLARCLEMLPRTKTVPKQDDTIDDDAREAREFIIREFERLDRLAERAGKT